MPIPSYQDLMLPLLLVLGAAEKDLHQKECTQRVSDALQLTEAQRSERLPSGIQTYVHNRIGWAGWYMQQAGLVMKPKKGFLRITEEGRALLAKSPTSIDNKLLATYPSFQEKVMRRAEDETTAAVMTAIPDEQTPTDQIEEAYQKLNQTLSSELLDLMAKMDPYKFEQLVVDLLFAMGYGGSRAEAALVTKKSGDEGIDGIINEDRLGLDVIYVQAKRWQATVGRAEIQSFVGALVGKHAHKGVFITTSDFHKTAVEYARGVQHKVVLINGRRLADLMIEHGVGVSTVRTLELKRVDSDYFEE
ncbi:restriction system protein [Prosthecobacter debontii]|uniref:Restriction system protein n=1 Tax=Prosthecobacter debontii TaxID=48467 RepID=A0A1T4Z1T7_9BACT|nr:restriction endonuclease [Prosthecobacter debontii]SKB08019.1 restriction system protein [Prosthecobacter debontii]